MSQNTLKVHDLNEDAEFDENGVEAFDEKALVEEEPSDNDLAEEELLSQGATQRVLDATQLYLGESISHVVLCVVMLPRVVA